MTTVEIEHLGIELIVKGEYSPPVKESIDYPPESAYFEIQHITAEDSHVNLTDLLEEHLDKIAELCIDKIEEQ